MKRVQISQLRIPKPSSLDLIKFHWRKFSNLNQYLRYFLRKDSSVRFPIKTYNRWSARQIEVRNHKKIWRSRCCFERRPKYSFKFKKSTSKWADLQSSSDRKSVSSNEFERSCETSKTSDILHAFFILHISHIDTDSKLLVLDKPHQITKKQS